MVNANHRHQRERRSAQLSLIDSRGQRRRWESLPDRDKSELRQLVLRLIRAHAERMAAEQHKK
jgi:hypothetical protein